MLLGGTAKDKDIVNVRKTEIQVFEDLFNETLEVLGSVTWAKGHEGTFKKAEWCGNCSLLDVFRMDRDLMLSSYQVNL